MQGRDQIPEVYISYAWNSESDAIANAIETEFQKAGIRTVRDKKNLNYKGRIKGFMDQIGRGKYIVLIISNKYLRSEYCMYELLQIFKSGDFYERIFPVVTEEVKISKATDRLGLVKYWENEVENLDGKIRELKALSNIQGVTEDLNLYSEIRHNIARLTSILKDINTLNTQRHISSDFKQLTELVKAKINIDFREKQRPFLQRSLVNTVVAGLLILFLLALGYTLYERPLKGKEIRSTTEMDSLKTAADSSTYANDSVALEKRTEDIPAENPEKKSDVSYEVVLTVPSNMTNAAVFVDNQPAEVIERNLIFIKVRVWKKDRSHHFEIRDGDENCQTDKLIQKNNVRLALCV